MADLSSRRRHYWCDPFANQHISPYLVVLLLLTLANPSATQLTFGNAPLTTTSIPATSTKLLSSQTPTHSTIQSQATSPSSSSPTTTTTDDDPSDDLQPSNVVNYYFLLLALLVLILLASLWTIHRRRKRKKALSRNGGHSALARDLEGWRGNRRWAGAGGGRGWRSVFGGHGLRREEDRDERGEGPPPYEYLPQASRPPPPPVVWGASRDRGSRGGAVRTSFPLYVLSEGGEEAKPPEYGRT